MVNLQLNKAYVIPNFHRNPQLFMMQVAFVGTMVLPILNSCVTVKDQFVSEVPLTLAIRTKSGVSDADLMQLDVYVSREIVLEKVDPSKSGAVAGGKLQIQTSRQSAKVTIPALTRGKIWKVGSDYLDVSLDRGTVECLRFHVRPERTADNFDRYTLSRSYQPDQVDVIFGPCSGPTETYKAMYGSGEAYLLIRVQEDDKTSLGGRELKGY